MPARRDTGTRRPELLLTGFEPFGGQALNPSWMVAQALHGRQIAGTRVVAVQLPCVFHRALGVLDDALRATRPVLVLALGQAAGRAALSLERVAINLDDASIADNAGAMPVDVPVVRRARLAYATTLPVKAMAHAVAAAGLPVELSSTAGHFVCNHVFFGLMHRAAGQRWRAGFMHVPALPEQAQAWGGMPSMPLHDMVRGTQVALKAALLHTGPDVRVPAGRVC